ncbi:outer membrane protein assembly factor BamA [Shimia sediminis]|uniref:outer membrane protein assembly factor BamA n=1 Tax=Shimia sediminis TaxID=2497945 RepID=UPI000F8F764A|nr:outer membrane protein assembly factor BamA [Shimia sediminis]
MTKQNRAVARAAVQNNNKLRHFLLTIFFLISAALLALPTFAEAQQYKFDTISVEGNKRIESTAILTYAGIAKGQTVTAGQLNNAYQNILDSGLFESVELAPSGNRLKITVAEYPTINRISIEGNARLKDDALSSLIESKSRQVLNPTVAERDAARLAEAYSQAGRLAARVTPRVIRLSDNRADLVFEIFEGDVIEVERVSFVGNQHYSDRRLRRVVDSKQAGILRRFVRSDTFVSDRIEFDKQVLRDFYLSRGYVDFRVTGVNAELARERDGYFITFNVQEGQQFTFGEVSVLSEIEGLDAAVYLESLKIKSGVVYSPSLVENSIARLERLALQHGQDFVRVDPRITRNERDLTLDVEFALVRGPRIFVERIDVEGNTSTLDRVIRQKFRIVEGDPFNPREIRESAERIRALGFFETAEVNAREGSTPDQVVVDVDVVEKPTGSLKFGATYGSSVGIGLVVSFAEKNFLGRGQDLSLSFSTASEEQEYFFSFFEPAFLGRDIRAGFVLRYQERDPDQARWTTSVGEFRPSLRFPVSENGRLTLRYTGKNNKLETGVSYPGSLIDQEEARGDIWQSALGYTYAFDTRNKGLDPTSGVRLEFSQDFGGLGGDYEYISTRALAIAETTVLQEEVTLRASFEGGGLHSPNKDSRVTDRFFLNARQMRGFEPLGISPREIDLSGATSQNDALGGTYYAVARFEAEFPLGLPNEYGITGGVFYDVGSVWGLDNTSGIGTIVHDDFNLHHVIGFSLFWDTAIGPLRFDFTKALKKETYDEERNFDFTIAAEF